MYQYVFEDKYVTEVAEPGYVRREIYHKRHKDGPQLSAKVTTMMQEGFLLLTGFLLAVNSYFMVTVLALLVLFWVFRLKHKKQTKIKETLVVKESIPDVAFILKHKRK
jgi:Ca2+/Na+ antiporter